MPPDADLAHLREAATGCRGCELYRDATQTVFGEGPAGARVVMVGEQPGDQEDRAGHPFVGPAGRLLDRALAEAGFDRDEVYVTNAVKHFKFVERGKLGEVRGVVLDRPDYQVTATVHPSAVLRSTDRKAAYAEFVGDLARIHDMALP